MNRRNFLRNLFTALPLLSLNPLVHSPGFILEGQKNTPDSGNIGGDWDVLNSCFKEYVYQEFNEKFAFILVQANSFGDNG